MTTKPAATMAGTVINLITEGTNCRNKNLSDHTVGIHSLKSVNNATTAIKRRTENITLKTLRCLCFMRPCLSCSLSCCRYCFCRSQVAQQGRYALPVSDRCRKLWQLLYQQQQCLFR